MQRATASAVKARYPTNLIAILIDGVVASAGPVLAVIDTGLLSIPGPFLEKDAEALAVEITS